MAVKKTKAKRKKSAKKSKAKKARQTGRDSLDRYGLNDLNADKHLGFLVNQTVDLNVKLEAIHEYNRLIGRIIEEDSATVKPAMFRTPKQLALSMNQFADFSEKLDAIRQYNRLTGRIM